MPPQPDEKPVAISTQDVFHGEPSKLPAQSSSAPLDQPKVRKLSNVRKKELLEIDEPNGQTTKCYLFEMMGDGRDAYLNEMGDRVKYNPKTGRPMGMKKYNGMAVDLVKRCLFDMSGKLIGAERIQNMTSSLQSELFKICQDINGLKDDSEEEAKND